MSSAWSTCLIHTVLDLPGEPVTDTPSILLHRREKIAKMACFNKPNQLHSMDSEILWEILKFPNFEYYHLLGPLRT